MVNCRRVEENLLEKMHMILEGSIKLGKEAGFKICQKKDGSIYSGGYCVGSECLIDMSKAEACREGDREIADFHTHPDVWTVEPSSGDITISIHSGHDFFCIGGEVSRELPYQEFLPVREITCWDLEKKPLRVKKTCTWQIPAKESRLIELFLEQLRKARYEFWKVKKGQ